MLESLNYSFRNPKKHNLSNLPHQTVEKLQKNDGVLRGPQRDKQRWRVRLGIWRVKKSALTTSLCAEPRAQACRISLTASDHQESNFPGAAEANKLNKHRNPPTPALLSLLLVTGWHSWSRSVGLNMTRLLQAVSQRSGLTYRPSFHSVSYDG